MVANRVTRIDNLQRDCGAACDTIVVRIEATCGELVAATTCASTIRLTSAIQSALKELLVDGAVIDARAAGPFPGVLSAVTGAAHPAIILRKIQYWSVKVAITRKFTEVDATPSQPLGALVEVQSPIEAACESLVSDDSSLLFNDGVEL